MPPALTPARILLDGLFRTAVEAAHPAACLPAHLPPPPAKGRLIILAAGKAAGSMTEVAEGHYLERLHVPANRLAGIAVTRHGYAGPTRRIEMIEAGHPVPDAAGLAAAERVLKLADTAAADDLVLVLMSGGASANWIAPADGLSFADKQAVTRALLRSGANIGEMNTVRKHLSRIKGGRLALRAQPARVVTLAISDVPGDDPAVIGSGPTVPDPSTLADARAVLTRYKLDVPPAVQGALDDPANESPKPGHPAFAVADYKLVAKPADAFRAVEAAVRAAGYECIMLGDRIEGEARTVAAEHASHAIALQREGRRAVLLSGGELTVTIRGKGRGGPEPGICVGARAGAQGDARDRGACRRHRRHRRRRRLGHRPCRRRCRCRNAAARKGAWPRSGPVSCRKRFHRLFRANGRSGDDRTDLHQRERLPGDRR